MKSTFHITMTQNPRISYHFLNTKQEEHGLEVKHNTPFCINIMIFQHGKTRISPKSVTLQMNNALKLLRRTCLKRPDFCYFHNYSY